MAPTPPTDGPNAPATDDPGPDAQAGGRSKPFVNRNNKGDRPKAASSTGRRNPVADQTTWRRKLKASRIKFDDAQKAIYLRVYAETGRKYKAADAAGVSVRLTYDHAKNDPDFAEAEDAALQAYRDRVQAEVRRRGVDGWEEPLYQGGRRALEPVLNADGTVKMDAGGKPVMVPASVRRFSDRALELEAKRAEPEYRDKINVNQTTKSVAATAHVIDVRAFTPAQRDALRVLIDGGLVDGAMVDGGADADPGPGADGPADGGKG